MINDIITLNMVEDTLAILDCIEVFERIEKYSKQNITLSEYIDLARGVAKLRYKYEIFLKELIEADNTGFREIYEKEKNG